jgi:hypothetical protein
MGASAGLSHSAAILKNGARFAIGRRLCQLQAMGGVINIPVQKQFVRRPEGANFTKVPDRSKVNQPLAITRSSIPRGPKSRGMPNRSNLLVVLILAGSRRVSLAS